MRILKYTFIKKNTASGGARSYKMDKQKLNEQAEDLLFEKGVIILQGEVNKELLDTIRSKLFILQNITKHKDIKLFIDSSGGSVDAGLALYDIISLSQKQVIGIVNGQCASIAVTILQACTTRILYPSSWLFFHEIESELKVRLAPEYRKKIEINFTRSLYLQKRLNSILSDRSGQSIKTIKQLMRRGDKLRERITPENALKMGFIDKIEKTKLF